MIKKVLSDRQAARLMYAIDSMDEYYKRDLLGIPSRIRVKKILQELKNVKGKKVLDVGCEAGFITMKMAERGALVTGVDLIQEPLEKFKQILTTRPKLRKRIKLKLANANKLPFTDHQFDVVIAAEVIEHMSKLTGFVKGAHLALKPTGRLIITFPNEGLREKFYPILTVMGINANIEPQVTIKSYQPEEVVKIFGKKFDLKKHYRLPWWMPITHLMVFKPK